MSPALPPQKPWPIKWVVIVVAVFVVSYTYLTLHFRRPEPAYQPYHDTKERITVARLHTAGYERIFARAETPAESQSSASHLEGTLATVSALPGGLDDELKKTLIDQPELPLRFTQVRTPAEAHALLPCSIQFTCALPNNKEMLSGTYVYVKDEAVMIVPTFEKIEGNLSARTPESLVQVTLPSGALSPGTFHVTLVGQKESKQWNLQVH